MIHEKIAGRIETAALACGKLKNIILQSLKKKTFNQCAASVDLWMWIVDHHGSHGGKTKLSAEKNIERRIIGIT